MSKINYDNSNKNRFVIEDIKNANIRPINKHYSYSFISSWNNCPAKTGFSLVKSIRSDSPALIVGNAVHKQLEADYSGEDIDAFAKLSEDNKKRALQYIESYNNIESYSDSPDSNIIFYTEQSLTEELSPLGVTLPKPLRGIIDRIDIDKSSLSIIDYKTSMNNATRDSAFLDQVTIYKWLVEESFGIGVDNCYIALIAPNESKYIKYEPTLSSQSKLIDKIFTVDESVNDALENGEFNKIRGDHCRMCEYKDYCFGCLDLFKEIENKEGIKKDINSTLSKIKQNSNAGQNQKSSVSENTSKSNHSTKTQTQNNKPYYLYGYNPFL